MLLTTFASSMKGRPAVSEPMTPTLTEGRSPRRSAGNPFSAGQIDDFAKLLQVVEIPFPVRPDGKDVHAVFSDIVNFLTLVFLDDDLVGIARGPDRFDALHQVVIGVHLTPFQVELVGGDTHDEPVAEFLGPPEQVDVSLMQQVVCSVCDDFFHFEAVLIALCRRRLATMRRPEKAT